MISWTTASGTPLSRATSVATRATRAEVVKEVRLTVVHEVAHHFGLSDAALDETKYG